MTSSCIIIDDEKPARVLLETYVNKIKQLELLGSFSNALEAADFLSNNKVDIILSDIQMPDLTGIEFVKSLTHKPKIIFTTAYQNYALDGFELSVTDYLLKPIRFDRFLNAINKALDLITLEKDHGKTPLLDSTLTIKADHKIHRVKLQDIVYIEGLKEYVRYHTIDQKIISLESLKKLEETLPKASFTRIHKSFIVNNNSVKSIYGNQIEIAGKYIPIGKTYRDTVIEALA